eukprot:5192034-Prorocentrum_lima.AAC.1
MTSSLVGSEMCIRDSLSTPLRLPSGCQAGSRPECAQRSTSVSDWNLAVSYTHLTLPTICSV